MIIEILQNHKLQFFPVLGSTFQKHDFCPMPLSVGHPKLVGFDVTHYHGLDTYVKFILKENNAKVAHGGYGEHRAIYTTSGHFTNDAEIRNIHWH